MKSYGKFVTNQLFSCVVACFLKSIWKGSELVIRVSSRFHERDITYFLYSLRTILKK